MVLKLKLLQLEFNIRQKIKKIRLFIGNVSSCLELKKLKGKNPIKILILHQNLEQKNGTKK